MGSSLHSWQQPFFALAKENPPTPPCSPEQEKRSLVFEGLIGVTFATTYPLLLASAFAMGFFLLSAGPIGFQYGAEVSYPAPEGTTNGLLLLMGQVSGIAFIFGMDSFKSATTGSMTMPLIVPCGLMALSLLLSAFLKESALIKGSGDRQ